MKQIRFYALFLDINFLFNDVDYNYWHIIWAAKKSPYYRYYHNNCSYLIPFFKQYVVVKSYGLWFQLLFIHLHTQKKRRIVYFHVQKTCLYVFVLKRTLDFPRLRVAYFSYFLSHWLTSLCTVYRLLNQVDTDNH